MTNSAQARADALRAAQQPSSWWGRLKALLGFTVPVTAAAAAEIRNWEAGAEGERRTAELLQPLGQEGWYGLYDRAVPGADVANVDFFLVAPSGRAFTVDAKLWSRDGLVRAANGRLLHGDRPYDRVLPSVLFETRQIEAELQKTLPRTGRRRTGVTPVIAMHNAPVDGGGFTVEGVRIVPAERLLGLLRSQAGPADPQWAATVAAAAERALPRYVEDDDL
ncbi:nuclease-related domain-containing protein [Streptomyces sp. NPDC056084]|uniref:nuclease-related domain-containing protein n=1 Tax=unclassified Streptomyces TaxID=2593676 RepID=UPI0035E091A6